jgi:hypothetical protein
VAAEFNGPARAVSLHNRLQGLKRQRDRLQEKQGVVFRDSDTDKLIEALEAEIERVRSELGREIQKDDTEKQK